MPEVKRISVPCPFDLSRVSIKEGEYHVPELCNALVKPDLVKMTVKAYMVHASSSLHPGAHAICTLKLANSP